MELTAHNDKPIWSSSNIITNPDNRQITAIVPDKIYHWCDSPPSVGLHEVATLDLESKRQELFGRCDIDRYLAPEQATVAMVFDTMIGLEWPTATVDKIFFPSAFLCQCYLFRSHLGRDWDWSPTRKFALTCPMRQPRYGRLISSCWLANHADQVDFLYTQNWDPEQWKSHLYELLQIGGLKDWTNNWGPEVQQMPELTAGELPAQSLHSLFNNFKKIYQEFYSNAAAAAVVGAVFWEHGSELCEKYLNAVYSGCIPIVHGYRVYDRLRAMGFDVFDDVIDTSSQWDTNPVTATWNLFDRNLDFFQHACDIVSDPGIQRRLRYNLELSQNGAQLFENIVNDLNSEKSRDIFVHNQRDIIKFFTEYHNIDFQNFLEVK
jgi:hypothetical protein